MIWRVVMVEGKASLEEVERYWSLYDLLDANDLLDAVDDLKRRSAGPGKGGRR